MSWTDERIETLKKLWANGLSASQIADDLRGVTRSAVCGKLKRLGLTRDDKSASTPRFSRPRVKATGARSTRNSGLNGNVVLANFLKNIEPHEEEELPSDMVIPLGQRRTLLELNDEICHWPIGHPSSDNFYFCGGNNSTGLPYCAYHSRIAYQSPAARHNRRELHTT